MAEETKLNSALNGMHPWVKVFAFIGAPMIFAAYFMAKDAGYVGASEAIEGHKAIMIKQQATTNVLMRMCVRMSETDSQREACLRS